MNQPDQRVLLLNASYEPLRVITTRRAVTLLVRGKAELVEAGSLPFRSATQTFTAPLVVRLLRYITLPRWHQQPCTRRGVLLRDQLTCQYCGVQPGRTALSLDHVVPRSQGGETRWENVVVACRACNHRKGGRTPEQAGMILRSLPQPPHRRSLALLDELQQHTVWRKYAA